jgi:phosphoribosylglycinamide formyltransferase-1
MPAMRQIVVLISGRGSNMQALALAAERQRWAERGLGRLVAVISNRPGAAGLAWAQQHGLATQVVDHTAFKKASDHGTTVHDRAAFDAALAAEIERHSPPGAPCLVVLAGFMRVLTPGFVRQFEGRLINIHPSLLPAFAGLDTHARAIAAGCQVAGATVHLVTAELDAGPILAQAVVPVLPGDTPDALAARVLSQEHRILPAAVEAWLRAHPA